MPWEEVEACGEGWRGRSLWSRRSPRLRGRRRGYHGQEVSSGGETAAVRDPRSVSGGMSQDAVLLHQHLITHTHVSFSSGVCVCVCV